MTAAMIEARFFLRHIKTENNGFTLDVDLRLPGRGVSAVFGPSGSGKTLLLRCIAGLQRAEQGVLCVEGQIWQNTTFFLPAHKRPLGYVFQESSLFPHLSARGNLKYALQRASAAPPSISFVHAVSLLGIDQLLDRMPDQLSGGERQRVAIARALLINPRLLLMDEPLASLDLARKQEILPYLERLRAELDIPILYISHAPDEVARLADHLVVLDQGKAVASGPLGEILTRLDLPMQLGEDAGVVLDATVIETNPDRLARIAFAGGELWVHDRGDAVGQTVRVRILARDISLALEHHHDTSILNILSGKVVEIAPDANEAMALVRVQVGTSTLIVRVTRRSVEHLQLVPGKPVWAQIKSAALVR